MSDMYTLGVHIQGDAAGLHAALNEAAQAADAFSKSTTEALGRAGAAASQSSQVIESSSRKTAKATQTTARETQKAGDAFQDYMKRATKANDEVAKSSEDTAQRSSQSFGGLGRTLGRLTGVAGVAMLAKQVWDTGAGFHEFSQNAEIAMTTLLGGLPQAKTFLAEILEFAKQTPFAFPELAESAQQLLAMNVAAEDVIPTLRALGDAASSQGRGIDRIQQLVSVIGQINTVGELSGDTLRRLNEAGVQATTGLANLAGVTAQDFQKMVSEGLVPADEALRGLRTVINEGTDGINGQTVALGGFMEQIKGSGGLTATMDSTKSAFRNTSAALTESLLPAFTGLLEVSQGALGMIKNAASGFNELSSPVRNAAIAFTLAATASRLLNAQGRATQVWAGFRTAMQTSRVQVDLLTLSVGRTRAMMFQTRAVIGGFATAIRGAGAAVMTAFGGPVGLAIAGAVAGIAAFSTASSEARAKTMELADSLDQVTGALTAQSTEWVKNELLKEQNFGVGNTQTMIDMAEKLGVSIGTLTEAYLGQPEAIEALGAATERYLSEQSLGDSIFLTRQSEVDRFNKNIADQAKRIEEGRAIVAAKMKVDDAATAALEDQADAYEDANKNLTIFTEEQAKAIKQAEDNAAKAMSVDMSALGLDISTADDRARALDGVVAAERRLRDAQEARAETAKREKVTAQDLIRADESVADAKKALKAATKELADVEDRQDPAAQYRKQVQGIIDANETFLADIQTLADRGLNLTDLQDIINKGAEGSIDIRAALLGDDDMVDFANEAREILNEHAATIAAQAGVVETHMQATGNDLMGEIGLGMRLAAEQNSSETLLELAARLGEKRETIKTVGNALGLEFVNGFRDSLGVNIDHFFNRPGGGGGGGNRPLHYADGGIYPGYTPGRDVGYIGVSGGEAIMRPEWTRAIGPDLVHRWNRIARTSGVDGVRSEMQRFLGNFNQGGIAGSPQVVTVPVSVTNERHTPWTIQNAYFTDPTAANQFAERRRARMNWGGGSHGS